MRLIMPKTAFEHVVGESVIISNGKLVKVISQSFHKI